MFLPPAGWGPSVFLLLPDPVIASVYWHGPRAGRRLLSLPLQSWVWRFVSFRRIPFSWRSISVAPVRGGTHFLCCCKESKQRKQLFRPAVTRNLGSPLVTGGTRLKSALKHLIGLGSRTVRRPKTLRTLVQHERASAQRYALPPGMQGKPTCGKCSEMETAAKKHARTRLTGRPRSGPELFGAEPVRCVVRWFRPCASQARLGV